MNIHLSQQLLLCLRCRVVPQPLQGSSSMRSADAARVCSFLRKLLEDGLEVRRLGAREALAAAMDLEEAPGLAEAELRARVLSLAAHHQHIQRPVSRDSVEQQPPTLAHAIDLKDVIPRPQLALAVRLVPVLHEAGVDPGHPEPVTGVQVGLVDGDSYLVRDGLLLHHDMEPGPALIFWRKLHTSIFSSLQDCLTVGKVTKAAYKTKEGGLLGVALPFLLKTPQDCLEAGDL
mmetsp:Transcript_33082/g.95112  ORF Transcript_33082/g.95112 Transcript_33082/m.95112 type:complete len:232 (-) Transcript_33082:2511-3206(-)